MTFFMFQKTSGQITDEVIPLMSEMDPNRTITDPDLQNLSKNTFIRKAAIEGFFGTPAIANPFKIQNLPFRIPPGFTDSFMYFKGTWEREYLYGKSPFRPSVGASSTAYFPRQPAFPNGSPASVLEAQKIGPIQRERLKLSFFGYPKDTTVGSSTPPAFAINSFSAYGQSGIAASAEWVNEYSLYDRSMTVTRGGTNWHWVPVRNESNQLWPIYSYPDYYLGQHTIGQNLVFAGTYNPAVKFFLDHGAVGATTITIAGRTVPTMTGIITLSGIASSSGAPSIATGQSDEIFEIEGTRNYAPVYWTAPFQVEAGRPFKIIIDASHKDFVLLTGINVKTPIQP